MADERECFLALDAGTGAGRAVLFDGTGEVLAEAYEEWAYRPVEGLPQAQEFDPGVVWETFGRLCRAVLERAGIEAGQVAAVSTTSQRGGYVFLDWAGTAIYGGPNLDQRPLVHPLFRDPRFRQLLIQQTGQGIRPYRLSARLTWFQAERPEFFARIACVLGLNDWLVYQLTGERRVDPSHASFTGLFDVTRGDWADEFIAALGLPRAIFPPVSWPAEAQGRVTDEASRVTGLSPGTPVYTGAGDTQAALLGCGALAPGTVVAVSGTTTPLQMVLDRPVVDLSGAAWTSCYVTRGRWVLEANCGLTGLALRWLRDLFGEADYGFVERALREVSPGSSGVLNFLGPLPARPAPLPPGRLEQIIIHGPSRVGRGELTRSLCESVAYAAKANLDLLGRLTGYQPSRLIWCGGMARNRALVELLAAVAGLPVEAHPGETSALGTAMCAAAGLGTASDLREAARRLSRPGERVEADPALQAIYGPLYERWLREAYQDDGEQAGEG